MPLETFNLIASLNASNPVGATDLMSSLDDHVRGVKSVLLAQFPNFDNTTPCNLTPAEIKAIRPETRMILITGLAEELGMGSAAPASALA